MTAAFHSLHAFLTMGHNGDYVWAAYSIVFAVLIVFLSVAIRKNKHE